MHAECNTVMSNQSICPSVCPMPVVCLNEWTYHHTVSTVWWGNILVFWASVPSQNSQGNPQWGGTKYMEVGEFCKYSFLSHKWYEIGQQLLWITNRKSQTADQSVSVAMTLSDLERQGMTGQNFMADLHNYACMVWSRINEFVKVTQVEDKHISRDLTHPNPNGAGPQHPPFYGIPLPMPSLT